MDCRTHEPALKAHALGAPASPALEAHLASCEACRDVFASERRLLAAVDRVLDGARRVEPSPEFLARARRIPDEAPAREPWTSGAGWTMGLAAGLVALLAAAGLFLRGGAPPRDVAERADSAPSAVRASPALPPVSAAASIPAPPSPIPASLEPAPPPAPPGPATIRPARRVDDPPAVLVPPGQAEALVRLARLATSGEVAPPTLLLRPPEVAVPLSPPEELTIPPLEPLAGEEAGDTGVIP